MIGIYKIKIESKFYIGSSFDINRRIIQHKSNLSQNRHENSHMQNAYNKYKTFDYEILEEIQNCTDEQLRALEKEYIEKLKPEYNIQDPITHFGTKPIYQFDTYGNLLNSYTSVSNASLATNCSISNIMHAAQTNEKETRTAGGFYWQYEKDFIPREKDKRTTEIHLYNLAGFYITSFQSIKTCINTLYPNKDYSTVVSQINKICKNLSASLGGYRFSYEKVDMLDNTKLLSINKHVPIIMITPEEKVYIYEGVTDCIKHNNILTQSNISVSINKNKKYKGYKFLRLGTESRELLGRLENIKTETELETINGKV